jgi:hypothetical protein
MKRISKYLMGLVVTAVVTKLVNKYIIDKL